MPTSLSSHQITVEVGRDHCEASPSEVPAGYAEFSVEFAEAVIVQIDILRQDAPDRLVEIGGLGPLLFDVDTLQQPSLIAKLRPAHTYEVLCRIADVGGGGSSNPVLGMVPDSMRDVVTTTNDESEADPLTPTGALTVEGQSVLSPDDIGPERQIWTLTNDNSVSRTLGFRMLASSANYDALAEALAEYESGAISQSQLEEQLVAFVEGLDAQGLYLTGVRLPANQTSNGEGPWLAITFQTGWYIIGDENNPAELTHARMFACGQRHTPEQCEAMERFIRSVLNDILIP